MDDGRWKKDSNKGMMMLFSSHSEREGEAPRTLFVEGATTHAGDRRKPQKKEGPKVAALRGVSYGRTSNALRPVECFLKVSSHFSN